MLHLDRGGLAWCGAGDGIRTTRPEQCQCVPCLWAVLRLAEEAKERLVEMRDKRG